MSRDPVIHEPSARERGEGIQYIRCDACGNENRPKETRKLAGIVTVICIHQGLCIGEAKSRGRWPF